MEGKNLLNGYELLGIAAIGAILILSVLLSGCVETGNQTGENGNQTGENGNQTGENSYVKVNVTDENKRSIISMCMKETINEKDKAKFYNCYKNKLTEEKVNDDYKLGQSMGVGGTPTFITGCDSKEMENLCSKLSENNRDACEMRLVKYGQQNKSLECKKDGKTLIYEFLDVQCPYCYGAEPLVEELRKRNDVEMSFHFFLIHPSAHKEHIAMKCAEGVGKFNEFKKCAFDTYFKKGIRQVD